MEGAEVLAFSGSFAKSIVLEQPTAAIVSDRTRPEAPMKPKCLILVAGIIAALSCSAFGQQDEKLGKLTFPTSCDPKVQAEFERGVAMIHSYWFLIRAPDIRGSTATGSHLRDGVLGNRA